MRTIVLRIGDLRLGYAFLFTIGYALLVVGILYPEAKNTIGGVPWTWLFVVLAFPIFLKICMEKESTRDTVGAYVSTIFAIGLWVVFSAVVDSDYAFSTKYLLEVVLILLVTVPFSAALFSAIKKEYFFFMLDGVSLILCLSLLLIRLSQGDFSREGSFLGLGPLTFIKYVGLGFLVRVMVLRRISLVPFLLYAFAFYIADSKGPLLFVLVTIAVATIAVSPKEFLKALPLIVILALVLVNSERVQALWDEVSSLNSVAQVTIQDRDVANEEISGTVLRLASIAYSIDLIQGNPIFGIGPGRWPIATGLPSVDYPHNIFLEIWSEWGLVPFLLILLTFTISGYALWQRSCRDTAILAVYCGLTALTSGALPDFRFFLIFFLLLMIDRRSESVESRSKK